MNPLRTLKILTRAQRLFGMLEKGSRDWAQRKSRGDDMSKSLFASKTFWFNVLTLAVELTGVLPIPQGVATVVVNVGNILIRTVTNQPVHLISGEDEK